MQIIEENKAILETPPLKTATVDAVAGNTTPLSKAILKRLFRNVASLFSVQLANLLLPLLTVPYVVRIIGPERLGLLNFSMAFTAYFTLLINYGFEMSAVRTIASNRTDMAMVNRVFNEVLAGKIVLWLLSTVIFGCILGFSPEFRAHWLLHICTYLSCVGIVLFPIWLYQAMEDLGRVAIFNLAVKLLFTFSVFLFIRQPENYIYQNLSVSVAQVVVSVVALKMALRRFGVAFAWPPLSQLVQRFRADSTLFFSSVSITLYANSSVFLLGLLSNPYNVGIFSAGTRVESLARSFVVIALNQAFFPIVANAFGQSREQGLRLVQTTFFPLLILMVFVSVGLWIIAPVFITLFYGNQFGEAVGVLRIVALLPVTIGINNLMGLHTMLNLRMDRAFFVITAIGSVVGLTLNVLFINRFGYTGAAWAWVLSEGWIMGAMFGYLTYKGVRIINPAYMQEAFIFSKNRLSTLLK